MKTKPTVELPKGWRWDADEGGYYEARSRHNELLTVVEHGDGVAALFVDDGEYIVEAEMDAVAAVVDAWRASRKARWGVSTGEFKRKIEDDMVATQAWALAATDEDWARMRHWVECGEPGCSRRPTTIALGVFWAQRQTAAYAFCDEHAAAAMSRARAEKAAEEGLQ